LFCRQGLKVNFKKFGQRHFIHDPLVSKLRLFL
jgi:hypothetical protein